ncbi:MAG: exodeoxyribonuclease VII small subunit [Candidatus Omnitrophica bacterium]|nr:exodeoxyribonuclease VII small subunit [Candidatus Omnitrophota bacterium]
MAERAEKLDFEKSLQELERVVEALESGALTLDQALKRYEEGVALVRACQTKLNETEKKIEVLTRDLDGSLKREPFDGDTVKARKKKLSSGDA